MRNAFNFKNIRCNRVIIWPVRPLAIAYRSTMSVLLSFQTNLTLISRPLEGMKGLVSPVRGIDEPATMSVLQGSSDHCVILDEGESMAHLLGIDRRRKLLVSYIAFLLTLFLRRITLSLSDDSLYLKVETVKMS